MIDPIIRDDTRVLDSVSSDEFYGKRVLVTGGAGFIGSWLCDALLRKGASITVVDDLSSGSTLSIDHLFKEQEFELLRLRVEDLDQAGEKYEYVIHLASRPSPQDFQAHPVETALPNTVGSYRVLELARRCDAIAFYASSSEVYGQAEVIPTPETCWGLVNALGPRGCYDESKRLGEALFTGYHREYGLDVRIARLFNTYGPRIRADGAYGRVVPRFIAQALSEEKLTVYGDGSQTRSFCYIKDTLSALLQMLTIKTGPHPINIGSPVETSIMDLARRVIDVMRSRSRIVHLPLPADDPKRRCPDISRAVSLLEWRPATPLEVGLSRTVAWYERNLLRPLESSLG